MPRMWRERGTLLAMDRASLAKPMTRDSLASLADKVPDDLMQELPIDIERIAMTLGARKIIRRRLDGDGMCYPMGRNGHIILLNEEHSLERQRFTCAHEVAHIILDPIYKRVRVRRQHDRAAEQLETACNQLASEILMPRKLFRQRASAHSWRLSSLPALAAEFQTSMEATSRTYVDTIGEPCVMLIWRLAVEGERNHLKLRSHRRNDFVRGLWCEIDAKLRHINTTLLTDSVGTVAKSAGYQRIRITQGGRQSFDTCFVDTLAYGYGPNRRVMNAVYPGRRISNLLKNGWTNGIEAPELSMRPREASGGQPA